MQTVIIKRKSPAGDEVEFVLDVRACDSPAEMVGLALATLKELDKAGFKVITRKTYDGRPSDGKGGKTPKPLGWLDVSPDGRFIWVNWRYDDEDPAIVAEMAVNKRRMEILCPDYHDRKWVGKDASAHPEKKPYWQIPAAVVIGAAHVYTGFDQSPAFKKMLDSAIPVVHQLAGTDEHFVPDTHMTDLASKAADKFWLTPDEVAFVAAQAQRGGSDVVGKQVVWKMCQVYANRPLEWVDNPKWNWEAELRDWINVAYTCTPAEVELVVGQFKGAADADRALRTRFAARQFVAEMWNNA